MDGSALQRAIQILGDRAPSKHGHEQEWKACEYQNFDGGRHLAVQQERKPMTVPVLRVLPEARQTNAEHHQCEIGKFLSPSRWSTHHIQPQSYAEPRGGFGFNEPVDGN